MHTAELEPEFANPVQDRNLDMVRNILFGEQTRENEKRLATLERFVKVWTSSVRDEMRKNFDTLSHEIQLVQDLLAEETKARLGDTTSSRKHFEQASKGIETLHKQVLSNHEFVQQRVDNEVSQLTQRIDQQREELQNQLKQAADQLRHDKADRKLIANLLDHVSQQLSGETL
ncbi:MAG: hypothetical protein RI964_1734 [Pseudomonadota bacterium]|jgi:cysteinyl-tRNA synthetase